MRQGEEATENQETVHILNTQSRDMTVTHFLTPWLQETGQGGLFFFFTCTFSLDPSKYLASQQNCEHTFRAWFTEFLNKER